MESAAQSHQSYLLSISSVGAPPGLHLHHPSLRHTISCTVGSRHGLLVSPLLSSFTPWHQPCWCVCVKQKQTFHRPYFLSPCDALCYLFYSIHFWKHIWSLCSPAAGCHWPPCIVSPLEHGSFPLLAWRQGAKCSDFNKNQILWDRASGLPHPSLPCCLGLQSQQVVCPHAPRPSLSLWRIPLVGNELISALSIASIGLQANVVFSLGGFSALPREWVSSAAFYKLPLPLGWCPRSSARLPRCSWSWHIMLYLLGLIPWHLRLKQF